jgi:hypothetical protein
MDRDLVLEVSSDRPREHECLDVMAPSGELLNVLTVRYMSCVLSDGEALVTALVCLAIRVCSDESRQECNRTCCITSFSRLLTWVGW